MSFRYLLWPKRSSDLNLGKTSEVSYSKSLLVATLATAFFLLLALEFRSPYYFLQDDGLDYFLPSYFHNWHSLLAGHLPLYDFHTFAGIPHMAMGQTAIFYLPQYFATFLSETIWGHPFATMDLMAFMHGLIAVAGGYVLLRYLGVTNTAAAFGALSALTGFYVWVGRMWPVALMLCAWFPWMVWASLRYLEKPGVGRAGWLMFFRLGLLYGGYPQFFVLAMIFEHLFALSYSLAVRRSGWKSRCIGYVALDIPTALLGLPFLLPVWAAVGRSLQRSHTISYAEFSRLSLNPVFWIFGQLLVFIQLRAPNNYMGLSLPYYSYIGYFSSLLPFGVEALWKKQTRSRPWIVAGGICFIIALLWCWNVIGPLIYHLPVLNRFRWPFKLIYFAGFFQCIIAAMVLTLWSRRWQRIAIAGFVLNWVVVFCLLPNHAWRIRKYHPPLTSPWKEKLEDGRYIAISHSPVFFASKLFLERNYAEVWRLDNLLGYETLVPRLNATLPLARPLTRQEVFGGNYNGPIDSQLLSQLKKWSVKYVVVGPGRADVSAKVADAGFQKEAALKGWTLWKDPKWLPRVRWGGTGADSGSAAGIRWVEHVNSIDVDLSQWPVRQLVMAFVANPGLESCVDGHCSPVANSSDGLIRFDVPPGTRHVRLVYHDALLLPSVLVALATLAVYLLLLFRSRRTKPSEVGAELPTATAEHGRGAP